MQALSRHDYNEAIKLFSPLIESGELSCHNRVMGLIWRGQSYGNIGRFDRAIADFTKAIEHEQDPEDGLGLVELSYANRCWAYEQWAYHGEKGQREHAIMDCREVLRLNPNNDDAKEALKRLRASP